MLWFILWIFVFFFFFFAVYEIKSSVCDSVCHQWQEQFSRGSSYLHTGGKDSRRISLCSEFSVIIINIHAKCELANNKNQKSGTCSVSIFTISCWVKHCTFPMGILCRTSFCRVFVKQLPVFLIVLGWEFLKLVKKRLSVTPFGQWWISPLNCCPYVWSLYC